MTSIYNSNARKPRVPRPDDLTETERLIAKLAQRLETSPVQAAQWVRRLQQRARDGSSRNVLGPDKSQIILEVLSTHRWSLTNLINRKLPLLTLQPDLKAALRSRHLNPREARMLTVIESEETRRIILDEISLQGRQRPRTREALEALISAAAADRVLPRALTRGGGRVTDSALEADLRSVIAQLEMKFGSRVVIQGFAVTIDGGSLEGLMALVDGLLDAEEMY